MGITPNGNQATGTKQKGIRPAEIKSKENALI